MPAGAGALHAFDFFGVALLVHNETEYPRALDDLLSKLTDVANRDWTENTTFDFQTRGTP
jgi:hypothetical protein